MPGVRPTVVSTGPRTADTAPQSVPAQSSLSGMLRRTRNKRQPSGVFVRDTTLSLLFPQI